MTRFLLKSAAFAGLLAVGIAAPAKAFTPNTEILCALTFAGSVLSEDANAFSLPTNPPEPALPQALNPGQPIATVSNRVECGFLEPEFVAITADFFSEGDRHFLKIRYRMEDGPLDQAFQPPATYTFEAQNSPKVEAFELVDSDLGRPLDAVFPPDALAMLWASAPPELMAQLEGAGMTPLIDRFTPTSVTVELPAIILERDRETFALFEVVVSEGRSASTPEPPLPLGPVTMVASILSHSTDASKTEK